MRMIIKTVLYALAIILSSPGYAAVTHSHEKYITQVNKANALIQLQIGLLYEEGIGFPQNYVFARYWFEKAAEQNNADALFYLGSYYIDGNGVDKNENKGIELYQQAASHGSGNAMNNLGLRAKQEGRIEDAISFYQQATSAGSEFAILNLGGLYQMTGDYDKSEQVLISALDKDDLIKAEGLNKLGNLYSDPGFRRYSLAKAEEYYLKSIALNNDAALNNVGMLYIDMDKYSGAYAYIKLAADRNLPGAVNNLGSLYRYGYGVKQDYAKALSLFQRAAELGSSSGLYNIASMYEKGEGVKQDNNKAIEYYEKALAAGHYPAQERIDFLKAKHKK